MKQYLIRTLRPKRTSAGFKQTNLGEFEAADHSQAQYSADCQTNLATAANKVFGIGNWKLKHDGSLVGGYMVCTRGEHEDDTIHVDPFPPT